MSERKDTPNQTGFFRETSGAGATVGSVLLAILLAFCLLGVYAVHTAAYIFEQRGLQRAMEAFLQSDEVRSNVAEVIRETFPEEIISDGQVDALVNDEAIIEAAGQLVYDTIHFEPDDSVDLYDHILSTLTDPKSAAIYGAALDRLTQELGVDDEAYRGAMEAIANEMEIDLPEEETDKLAMATAILQATVDERREQLPTLSLGALAGRESPFSAFVAGVQRVLVRFETPGFLLYNLLSLAVIYGLILLIKRNYRWPFLYCSIPYFVIVLLLLAANLLLVPVLSLAGKSGSFDLGLLTKIVSGALLHSTLFALGFAVLLLAAFLLLTLLQRKRTSRADTPDAEEAVAPQESEQLPL